MPTIGSSILTRPALQEKQWLIPSGANWKRTCSLILPGWRSPRLLYSQPCPEKGGKSTSGYLRGPWTLLSSNNIFQSLGLPMVTTRYACSWISCLPTHQTRPRNIWRILASSSYTMWATVPSGIQSSWSSARSNRSLRHWEHRSLWA